MSDDIIFRWILLAGIVLVLPIAIYHRLKSITAEKLDRTQEGWLFLGLRIVLAPPAMIGPLAYLIEPSWMAWSSVPLPTWARWAGIALGALAAGLLVWTLRTLGTNITDTVVTRREHTLVTGGPYRWIRHPFYVSALLAVVANSLAAANGFFFATGVAVFIMLALRSHIEEAKLIERFGDDYRDYAKRTGAFFPRLGKQSS
jgi:protein-S-isoprenylcysteine O-methyltransferase Ste14